MSGLTEQTELRLPGSDEWIVAGDEAFIAAHDTLMEALIELVEPYRADVVVADSPPFSSGPLSRTPMADDERIAAWNRQITSWGTRWPSVDTLGWTALLADLETAGTIRPDGVHLDHDKHTVVGERPAAELLRVVTGPGA